MDSLVIRRALQQKHQVEIRRQRNKERLARNRRTVRQSTSLDRFGHQLVLEMAQLATQQQTTLFIDRLYTYLLKKHFDLLFLEKLVFSGVTDMLLVSLEARNQNWEGWFNALGILDKTVYYDELGGFIDTPRLFCCLLSCLDQYSLLTPSQTMALLKALSNLSQQTRHQEALLSHGLYSLCQLFHTDPADALLTQIYQIFQSLCLAPSQEHLASLLQIYQILDSSLANHPHLLLPQLRVYTNLLHVKSVMAILSKDLAFFCLLKRLCSDSGLALQKQSYLCLHALVKHSPPLYLASLLQNHLMDHLDAQLACPSLSKYILLVLHQVVSSEEGSDYLLCHPMLSSLQSLYPCTDSQTQNTIVLILQVLFQQPALSTQLFHTEYFSIILSHLETASHDQLFSTLQFLLQQLSSLQKEEETYYHLFTIQLQKHNYLQTLELLDGNEEINILVDQVILHLY